MIRSHRTYRLLATRMAESGLDVLRFDYLGTGESEGDWRALSLEGSVADVKAAVLEIEDLAGVRDVSLVGLRAGALIAALASGTSSGVDRLILWDPVTDGRAYVDEGVRSGSSIGSAGDVEWQGFIFGSALQEGFRDLVMADIEPTTGRVLYVVSAAEARHRAVFGQLSNGVEQPEFVLLPNEPSWTELGNLGVGSTPTDIIEAIAGW